MNRPEYFFPDDIIVNNSNGVRTARLGYSFIESDSHKKLGIESELPVIYTANQLEEIANILHKNWLIARQNYRDKQAEELYDKNEIVDEFWVAHRVKNYEPKYPEWTVSAYGKNTITMVDIINWYKSKE